MNSVAYADVVRAARPRHLAAAIEVVEKHELLGRVLVRRHVAAEGVRLGSPLPYFRSPNTWSYVRFSFMMKSTCVIGDRSATFAGITVLPGAPDVSSSVSL